MQRVFLAVLVIAALSACGKADSAGARLSSNPIEKASLDSNETTSTTVAEDSADLIEETLPIDGNGTALLAEEFGLAYTDTFPPPDGVDLEESRCASFEMYSIIGSLSDTDIDRAKENSGDSFHEQFGPEIMEKCALSEEQYEAIMNRSASGTTTTTAAPSTTTTTSTEDSVDSVGGSQPDDAALQSLVEEGFLLNYTDELAGCIADTGVNTDLYSDDVDAGAIFIALAQCAPDELADAEARQIPPPSGVGLEEYRCALYELYSFVGRLSPDELAKSDDDPKEFDQQAAPIVKANCDLSQAQFDSIVKRDS